MHKPWLDECTLWVTLIKKYFYQVLDVKENIRENSPSSVEHLSAKRCFLEYTHIVVV